jgi:protein TonB
MNRERDIELIIPEVLGCQEEKDKKNLEFLKQNDDAFCWNDLGDYQNLAALLATTIEPINPSERPKEILVRNLNRLIFGKEDVGHTEKFVLVKEKHKDIVKIKTPEQKSINWESLSVPGNSKSIREGFEEVKVSNSSVKSGSSEIPDENSYDEHLGFEEVSDKSINSNVQVEESAPSLKKYVAVSVVLFLVIVSIVAYMFIFQKPAAEQFTALDEPKNLPNEIVEEFIYDGLKDYGSEVDTFDLKPVENIVKNLSSQEVSDINKTKKEESLLPKSPPELPDPIEAQLVTVEETSNTEAASIEEKLSAPPPKEKELVEEVEEPTFFVAVEEMPQPIGGLEGIQQKIQYPEIAKRAGIEGKVYVRAFVDENGNVVDAEVIKGIGAGCDEAALDAVIKTKFTPGKQRGKPIKVQVTVPILFRL